MTGHMLGAAGATEAGDLRARHVRRLPAADDQPGDPDPECDLDYIPNEARRAEYRYAISNGFGFGGHNASLVFERWDEHDGRREPEKVTL